MLQATYEHIYLQKLNHNCTLRHHGVLDNRTVCVLSLQWSLQLWLGFPLFFQSHIKLILTFVFDNDAARWIWHLQQRQTLKSSVQQWHDAHFISPPAAWPLRLSNEGCAREGGMPCSICKLQQSVLQYVFAQIWALAPSESQSRREAALAKWSGSLKRGAVP